jgi:hypothetical protein
MLGRGGLHHLIQQNMCPLSGHLEYIYLLPTLGQTGHFVLSESYILQLCTLNFFATFTY